MSGKAYAQSPHAQCDHDLQAGNMTILPDRLSCHDDYLGQIFFKFHLSGRSYGSDTVWGMHKHTHIHIHTHIDRINFGIFLAVMILDI